MNKGMNMSKEVYTVQIESDGYPWIIGQFDNQDEALTVYHEYQGNQDYVVVIKTSFISEDK